VASNFDIGFDADKFMALPPAERINACVALAKRAQELAAAAHGPYQAYYLRIASDWLSLAGEMTKEMEAPHLPRRK
jgi:hypothetical protein